MFVEKPQIIGQKNLHKMRFVTSLATGVASFFGWIGQTLLVHYKLAFYTMTLRSSENNETTLGDLLLDIFFIERSISKSFSVVSCLVSKKVKQTAGIKKWVATVSKLSIVKVPWDKKTTSA